MIYSATRKQNKKNSIIPEDAQPAVTTAHVFFNGSFDLWWPVQSVACCFNQDRPPQP